jgi:hypothetical protein
VESWVGVGSEGRGDLGGWRPAGGGLGSRWPKILEGKAGRPPVDSDLVGDVELTWVAWS